MSQVSKACCSIPPVTGNEYQQKGKYIELDGIKAYIVGPENATKAIFDVYDIFGYYPQTLRGADILATSDPSQQYLVIMPDFWEGNPVPMEWYPPVQDWQKEKLTKWFEENTTPSEHTGKVKTILEATKAAFPSIETWGLLGYCWGGKLVSILSGEEDTVFKAAVQTSPALVDPAEAEKIKIPVSILPSKDENEAVISKYVAGLKVRHYLETFKTQRHGWLSARGDLDDPTVCPEYERGYQLILQWFHEHL